MSHSKKQRSNRDIYLDQLRNDPHSFLFLHFDDLILRKLETYRLHRAGVAATSIAKAFGFTRPYLYEMWHQFETKGTEALYDKHWGSAPRKLTLEHEANIIRAKALHPERSDNDLAEEFGVDRTTVYRLLKEHGLQDLHRVIDRSFPNSKAKKQSVKKRQGLENKDNLTSWL